MITIKKARSFLRNNFLKKRLIFLVDDRLEGSDLCLQNDFEINVLGNSDKEALMECLASLDDYSMKEKILEKMESPLVNFCYAMEAVTGKLAGFWLVAGPHEDVIWFDNYYVKPGDIMAMQGFMSPEYRGRNVFPLIVFSTFNYFSKTGKVNRILYVVEKNNNSSVNANRKAARVVGVNYLIKFFRRNIFSLIIDINGWQLFYVYKKHCSNGLNYF